MAPEETESGEIMSGFNIEIPPPIAGTGTSQTMITHANNTEMAMNALQKAAQCSLIASPDFLPALPLYKRAPREDEDGRPLSDFMMIIPKLRDRPDHLVRETVSRIERVLNRFTHAVVFADLNLKLNVLWVIVRPEAKV